MSGVGLPWDWMARFHPVWIVVPILVTWLAARGEMGGEFNTPWFVLITLVVAVRFVGRGRNSSRLAFLGRSFVGLVVGLMTSTLLLGITFGVAYRCSGGGGGGIFTSSCDPDRAALTWFAVAVGVLAVVRATLALVARQHLPAGWSPRAKGALERHPGSAPEGNHGAAVVGDGLVTCPSCGQRTAPGTECQWCDQPMGGDR